MNDDLDQSEFDFEEDICRNYHGGESFSEAANDSVASSKSVQRERIMRYLAEVGDATSDESEQALGMPHQTASARFSELKKVGRIVPVFDRDGKRIARPTRHGRLAGVYRIARVNLQEAS